MPGVRGRRGSSLLPRLPDRPARSDAAGRGAEVSATTNPVPLDSTEVRIQFRNLAENRRKARGDYIDCAREEAEAEHRFRKVRAIKFAEARKEGEPQDAADIYARSEAADAELERNLGHSKAKAALLRIDELEADRANLRHLSEREERES